MSTLDELEALLAKATPGEWSYSGPHEEQGEWWIASPSERKDIPWSREDAALIAAARNHLGELLRIARAVAAWGPFEPDSYNGLSCHFCRGCYEMPASVYSRTEPSNDTFRDRYTGWKKRALKEMPHDDDCVYVAARKLAGGAP